MMEERDRIIFLIACGSVADPDPGSGIRGPVPFYPASRNRDPGSGMDKHPESAKSESEKWNSLEEDPLGHVDAVLLVDAFTGSCVGVLGHHADVLQPVVSVSTQSFLNLLEALNKYWYRMQLKRRS
jgi:hypothetical protein